MILSGDGGVGGSGNATSIQGIPVDATPPTNGQYLIFNSSSGEWEATTGGGGPPSGSAGGDLGGSYPNPTVGGLQGNAIAAGAPTAGQVLRDDGAGAWEPGTLNMDEIGVDGFADAQAAIDDAESRLTVLEALNPIESGDAAGGDLSGTYPNPTVDGLQGNTVNAGAPADGQALVGSSGAWEPGDVTANNILFDNAGFSLLTEVDGQLLAEEIDSLIDAGQITLDSAIPGSSEDETQGFFVGSVWLRINAGVATFYTCSDASTGSAVWLLTALPLNGGTLSGPLGFSGATAEIVPPSSYASSPTDGALITGGTFLQVRDSGEAGNIGLHFAGRVYNGYIYNNGSSEPGATHDIDAGSNTYPEGALWIKSDWSTYPDFDESASIFVSTDDTNDAAVWDEIPSWGRIFVEKSGVPAVGDDTNDGYRVGNFRIDETAGRAWLATSVSLGAADWLELGVGGGVSLVPVRFEFQSNSHGNNDDDWYGPAAASLPGQDSQWEQSYGSSSNGTVPPSANNGRQGWPAPCDGKIVHVSFQAETSGGGSPDVYFCVLVGNHVDGAPGAGGYSETLAVDPQTVISPLPSSATMHIRSSQDADFTVETDTDADVSAGDSIFPMFAIEYGASMTATMNVSGTVLIEAS